MKYPEYPKKKEDLYAISQRHTLEAKSKKQVLFEYLNKHPRMNLKGLYFNFSGKIKPETIRKYYKEWHDKQKLKMLKKDIRLMFNVFFKKTKRIGKLSKEEGEAIDRLGGFADVKEG